MATVFAVSVALDKFNAFSSAAPIKSTHKKKSQLWSQSETIVIVATPDFVVSFSRQMFCSWGVIDCLHFYLEFVILLAKIALLLPNWNVMMQPSLQIETKSLIHACNPYTQSINYFYVMYISHLRWKWALLQKIVRMTC